jgi:hypothetical protein
VQRAIAVAAERLLGPWLHRDAGLRPVERSRPRPTGPAAAATRVRRRGLPAVQRRRAEWRAGGLRHASHRRGRRAARSRRWRPKPRSPSRRWHGTNGAAAVNDDLSPLCTRPRI